MFSNKDKEDKINKIKILLLSKYDKDSLFREGIDINVPWEVRFRDRIEASFDFSERSAAIKCKELIKKAYSDLEVNVVSDVISFSIFLSINKMEVDKKFEELVNNVLNRSLIAQKNYLSYKEQIDSGNLAGNDLEILKKNIPAFLEFSSFIGKKIDREAVIKLLAESEEKVFQWLDKLDDMHSKYEIPINLQSREQRDRNAIHIANDNISNTLTSSINSSMLSDEELEQERLEKKYTGEAQELGETFTADNDSDYSTANVKTPFDMEPELIEDDGNPFLEPEPSITVVDKAEMVDKLKLAQAMVIKELKLYDENGAWIGSSMSEENERNRDMDLIGPDLASKVKNGGKKMALAQVAFNRIATAPNGGINFVDASNNEIIIKFASSEDALNFSKAIMDKFYWISPISEVKFDVNPAHIILKVDDYNKLMNSEIFIDLPEQFVDLPQDAVELSENLKPSDTIEDNDIKPELRNPDDDKSVGNAFHDYFENLALAKAALEKIKKNDIKLAERQNDVLITFANMNDAEAFKAAILHTFASFSTSNHFTLALSLSGYEAVRKIGTFADYLPELSALQLAKAATVTDTTKINKSNSIKIKGSNNIGLTPETGKENITPNKQPGVVKISGKSPSVKANPIQVKGGRNAVLTPEADKENIAPNKQPGVVEKSGKTSHTPAISTGDTVVPQSRDITFRSRLQLDKSSGLVDRLKSTKQNYTQQRQMHDVPAPSTLNNEEDFELSKLLEPDRSVPEIISHMESLEEELHKITSTDEPGDAINDLAVDLEEEIQEAKEDFDETADVDEPTLAKLNGVTYKTNAVSQIKNFEREKNTAIAEYKRFLASIEKNGYQLFDNSAGKEMIKKIDKMNEEYKNLIEFYKKNDKKTWDSELFQKFTDKLKKANEPVRYVQSYMEKQNRDEFNIESSLMKNFLKVKTKSAKATAGCETFDHYHKLSEQSLKTIEDSMKGIFANEANKKLYSGVGCKKETSKPGKIHILIPPNGTIERVYMEKEKCADITINSARDRAIFISLDANKEFKPLKLEIPEVKSGVKATVNQINQADMDFLLKMVAASRIRGVPVVINPDYDALLKQQYQKHHVKHYDVIDTIRDMPEKEFKALASGKTLTELVDAIATGNTLDHKPSGRIIPPKGR